MDVTPPIAGYLDRLSVRPGGRLAAKVSLAAAGPYEAYLVRVVSGDPNPEGPGLRLEDLSSVFQGKFRGRPQPIHRGSYGDAPGPATESRRITWTALAWFASATDSRTVLSHEDDERRLSLSVGPSGAEATVIWPGGTLRFGALAPLPCRRWVRLWLAIDETTGLASLGQHVEGADDPIIVARQVEGLAVPRQGRVLFGAEGVGAPTRHFNGKIEAPAIFGDLVERWSALSASPDRPVLAAWDFSRGIEGLEFEDLGPQALRGHLINLPTRGVVGARWSGLETCWRHAPDDYAAIHFHEDDLDDCRWRTDFEFEVPDGLASGAYALKLQSADGADVLPFYVLPRRKGPFASAVFLAPTFTYQAYANHARGNADDAYQARVSAWNAAPCNPDQFPLYGPSTYNRHPDGSGVAFSTRLRPILTMRPGFLTFNDPRGSGLRHYPADSHLLAWLEDKAVSYDVVTDEDLDDEGIDLLAPYQVVLTGSHPEYHTLRTLDALQAYVDRGGRLACLGANAFYWRIARSPDLPHVIEIRRAEGGIRAWAAEPGEYHHALDGQLGGLWRRNRRPPQQLTGLGFSGQGLFEGTSYRRLAGSYAQEASWIFDGVEAQTFGDYGLSGGGAAGFELDRADEALGTPANAILLARSETPPSSFVTVPEELLTHVTTVSGEAPEALIRGEMIYFRTPGGGEVFSVGSITFLGSLWRNGFEGPVSQILENVVRRFACQPASLA